MLGEVFCDWLDVTCSPESTFVPALSSWCEREFPIAFADDESVCYRVGSRGILKLSCSKQFHRASASGDVLSFFRKCSVFGEYLGVIGAMPHTVTRLDAALDVAVDAPSVLRSLEQLHPSDWVSFTRKAIRVKRMYSCRDDGLLSGTWYAGHRSKARITARVYDKQLEALEKRCEVIEPTTRYEITFKKDLGCTLRDAYMPQSLFYEYSGKLGVDRPGEVPVWEPHGVPWVSDVVDPDMTFGRLQRRIDESPEVAVLGKMAAEFGEVGIEMMLKQVRRVAEASHDQRVESRVASGGGS